MSGINIINIYAQKIFKEIADNSTGAESLTPKQMTYFIGASAVFGALSASITAKNIGRKPLLVWAHILMGLCLLAVAVGYLINQTMVCLSFMCLFCIVF
jgi:hypothetical protein